MLTLPKYDLLTKEWVEVEYPQPDIEHSVASQ